MGYHLCMPSRVSRKKWTCPKCQLDWKIEDRSTFTVEELCWRCADAKIRFEREQLGTLQCSLLRNQPRI